MNFRDLFAALVVVAVPISAAARDYAPDIGHFVQSDPIGLQGGTSTYAYAASRPLAATDPDGLRVTIYSRLVEDPRARAIRARHAWLRLEPDDLAQVQCLLRQIGAGHIAFPISIGGYVGPNGSLIVAANAPSDSLDITDPARLSRVAGPPGLGLSCGACGSLSPDSKFIFDLVLRAGSYGNDLPYNPIPVTGAGYNSNSFAQGLLNSTGFSGQLDVGNTLGSGKPVPMNSFQR